MPITRSWEVCRMSACTPLGLSHSERGAASSVRTARHSAHRHGMPHPYVCEARGVLRRVGGWWHCFCYAVMARDGRRGNVTFAGVPIVRHALVGQGCNTGHARTGRSATMGNTTDKMKKGIKDAAGAVKRGADKGKDAAVRAVDKGKDAAARGAEQVQDKTDR